MTRLATNLAWFVAGLVLAVGLSGRSADFGTRAPEFQLEFGQCRFALERDGVFWQSEHYHRNYMSPRCASFGVADRFGGSRLGWRVAFLAAGNLEARDNVAMFGDELNHADGVQPCDTKTLLGCRAAFSGTGHTYGLSVSGTHTASLGRFDLIGEAGLFFFRSVFYMTVRPIDYKGDQQYGTLDTGWQHPPAPFGGVTLRHRDVYAALRYYWPPGHSGIDLTNHGFTQLALGYAWRFR